MSGERWSVNKAVFTASTPPSKTSKTSKKGVSLDLLDLLGAPEGEKTPRGTTPLNPVKPPEDPLGGLGGCVSRGNENTPPVTTDLEKAGEDSQTIIPLDGCIVL